MLYDLLIIGGGPAGYVGAERAAHAGLKTLLIEKRKLGGVCLNEGCIPTKALLYSAKLCDNAKGGAKYGVSAENVILDHAAAMKRKDKVVRTLVAGVQAGVKGSGATIVEGEAKILGRGENGYRVQAGEEVYEAKRLLICAGSEAAMPPIDGLADSFNAGFAMTNREILAMNVVPDTLAVIGGGVIGLEMASYFASAGSKVTVVEMLNQVGGPIDAEIAGLLQKNLAKKGIEFVLGARVTAVKRGEIVYSLDGKVETLKADKALVSIGRRPSTANLGLESIGVMLERGAIVTDETLRTNIPGVYAAGDINGKSMLAHTASREAEVAVNHMLGLKDRMSYAAIPGVIYTNPEVGTVGETLEGAKAKGISAEEVKLTMKYSGRYVAENEGGDGICKLVFDKARETIIGAHIISNYASEFIISAGMMVEKCMRVDDIKRLVFPHPTVCEIIREGVFQY